MNANSSEPIFTFQRPVPLIPGTLVKRYKRFLSDIELDTGETVVAHCVNTGAMEGLTTPGTRVWVSPAQNPARKLAYTWELAEINDSILGVDTGLPNRIVGELIKHRLLPWLADWSEYKPEKKYGEKSRVDFWLSFPDREHYLEVKNCHLAYPDRGAYFPDCVSTRASGHLHELINITQTLSPNGNPVTAGVLFFVQTALADYVRPSDLHDKVFAETAREVYLRGVQFSALSVIHTPEHVIVDRFLPVDMAPYDFESLKKWKT